MLLLLGSLLLLFSYAALSAVAAGAVGIANASAVASTHVDDIP